VLHSCSGGLSAPDIAEVVTPSRTAHRCFISKPRKPCCGHEMKAALVVLTGRHSQQQIACLPVVPIGKQAQIRNVVVCHLSVGRCEYAFRSTPASGSPARCAPLPKPRISACSTFNSPKPTAVRSSCRCSSVNCLSSLPKSALARCGLLSGCSQEKKVSHQFSGEPKMRFVSTALVMMTIALMLLALMLLTSTVRANPSLAPTLVIVKP